MLANEESILRQHVLLSIATGQEDARRLLINPNWQTAACFAWVTVGWRPPGRLMNAALPKGEQHFSLTK